MQPRPHQCTRVPLVTGAQAASARADGHHELDAVGLGRQEAQAGRAEQGLRLSPLGQHEQACQAKRSQAKAEEARAGCAAHAHSSHKQEGSTMRMLPPFSVLVHLYNTLLLQEYPPLLLLKDDLIRERADAAGAFHLEEIAVLEHDVRLEEGADARGRSRENDGALLEVVPWLRNETICATPNTRSFVEPSCICLPFSRPLTSKGVSTLPPALPASAAGSRRGNSAAETRHGPANRCCQLRARCSRAAYSDSPIGQAWSKPLSVTIEKCSTAPSSPRSAHGEETGQKCKRRRAVSDRCTHVVRGGVAEDVV